MVPAILVEDKYLIPPKLHSVKIDGTIQFNYQESSQGLQISQEFIPSKEKHGVLEIWTLTNSSAAPLLIKIAEQSFTEEDFGLEYGLITEVKNKKLSTVLDPNEKIQFTISYTAHSGTSIGPELNTNQELAARQTFINEMKSKLILETPNPVINKLFEFSKIRATESIYDSKMGKVHSPGGGRYYAGVWANDQAEYAGPFFPYLGHSIANEASINAYKKFFEQMKTLPNHENNLWSSFEMSGDLTCCGGDRGDAAMIAYGASHFFLALGDETLSEQYFPMIEWCLDYCEKKKTKEGVIASDTDEMEGRIETGSANLSTSSLYYGALNHTADLARSLKYSNEKIQDYESRAFELKFAIDSYFGDTIEGLETYKYFDTHKYLRHWICLPLVVGIHDRKEATIRALFEKLWSENGVHVEKNSENPDIAKIFWDRATLYALRGALIAGETETSLQHLSSFSENRLLGDRVPYVVEAYPEGQMAHLSAESALYGRVILEGLFGIYPISHRSFRLTPRLPKDWQEMRLKQIHAFGNTFDLTVKRMEASQLQIIVENHTSGERKIISLVNEESVDISLTY
jgi:hypothetical protein